MPVLLKTLFGKVFSDKGYVSQKLAVQMLKQFGIEFFAKLQLLARKRSIIETIIDQLKNISQADLRSRLKTKITYS